MSDVRFLAVTHREIPSHLRGGSQCAARIMPTKAVPRRSPERKTNPIQRLLVSDTEMDR